VPTEKIATESSLISHSFFLLFAYSNTSHILVLRAVNLYKFGDWSTDGREINFYTLLCAMRTIYGKPLGGKENCCLQRTVNRLEGLKYSALTLTFLSESFSWDNQSVLFLVESKVSKLLHST
jgi:hypothetical protein